jgi:AraC-like DNA-binding protein
MTRPAWFGFQDKNLLLQHGATDLLALAQRRGVPLHKLLSGTSLFETDLTRPLGRISHLDWYLIIEKCQQQLKSPELPFLLGEAMLQNQYISLCQGMQSANNLAQALRFLAYFRHQLFPGIYPQLIVQADTTLISIKSGFHLPQHGFVHLVVFSLIQNLIKQQFGALTGLTVLLKAQPETGVVHYQQHFNCPVLFCQPMDGLRIDQSLLLRPFKNIDRPKFLSAKRSCAQLSRILPKQPSLAELIYRYQRRALPRVLATEEVAVNLELSNSSFRRQLTQEFISFNKLIDEVRQDRAQQILQNRPCSNKELAQLLGYSDEHNFRRAFKRWTGFIPSNFRNLFGLSV